MIIYLIYLLTYFLGWFVNNRNKGPRWTHCRKRDADGKVRKSRDESETDASNKRGSARPEW